MSNDYAFVRLTPDATTILLQRKSDGAFIPQDPANTDYDDFLKAGSPADPVAAIPSQVVVEIRPVAFRWALRQTPDPAGKAANALEAITSALTDPSLADAKDAFEYAVLFERADLLALCGQLGFSTAQVDSVLTAAAARPGSGAIWS